MEGKNNETYPMTNIGKVVEGEISTEKDQDSQAGALASSVQSDELEKIIEDLNKGLPVDLSRFLKAGGRFAYFDKNRKISRSHVNSLMESYKRTGAVLTSIKILPGDEMLKQNYLIHDRSGNNLTLDTPDIKKFYPIIDGQHRVDAIAAWMSNDATKDIPITATLELAKIPEGVSVPAYMGELNLVCEKWDHRATKSLAGLVFESEGTTILSRINECIEEDKMSARGAWKVYKMTDGYNKKKYESALFTGKLPDELKGTEAEIERGDKIREAIQIGCRNIPKMKRNSAIVDTLIESYNAAPDTDKVRTLDLLLLFTKTLPDNVLTAALGESTVTGKAQLITKAWKEFLTGIESPDTKEACEELATTATQELGTMSQAIPPNKLTAYDKKVGKIL